MYTGQAGIGYYGTWMGGQNTEKINVVKDEILKVVDIIPVPKENNGNHLFTIGDYGASDGATSLLLLRDLIARIRKKHGEIPIQILYEDQPTNDFNSLFRRVKGLIPDPPSYLSEFQQVYVMASGTSFYDQVMPDNSAHLIMSFLSAGWLSRRPTTLQNSLCRALGASEEERQLITAQAAKDWESFLVLRAKELKPGGVLIVSTASESSGPTVKESEGGDCRKTPSRDLLTIWRTMTEEGKITQEEFVNTNFDLCYRHLEEIQQPFQDENSAVAQAGLKLIRAEQVVCQNLALTTWQEKLDKEGVDDRKMFAKVVLNQTRCWSNNAFMKGLSATRGDNEKEALVDELFQRLEATVTDSDPRAYKGSSTISYVFAQKL